MTIKQLPDLLTDLHVENIFWSPDGDLIGIAGHTGFWILTGDFELFCELRPNIDDVERRNPGIEWANVQNFTTSVEHVWWITTHLNKPHVVLLEGWYENPWNDDFRNVRDITLVNLYDLDQEKIITGVHRKPLLLDAFNNHIGVISPHYRPELRVFALPAMGVRYRHVMVENVRKADWGPAAESIILLPFGNPVQGNHMKAKDNEFLWVHNLTTADNQKQFVGDVSISGFDTSLDKTKVAISRKDGTIAIYDVLDDKLLTHLEEAASPTEEDGYHRREIFWVDDLIYGFRSEGFVVWDASTGKRFGHIPHTRYTSDFLDVSQNEKWLANTPDGQVIEIYDLRTQRLLKRLEFGLYDDCFVDGIKWHPQSKELAVIINDGRLKVWKTVFGETADWELIVEHGKEDCS